MKLNEKETEVLLSFLSFALFQWEQNVDCCDTDWNKLIASANDHVVTPLLYPGVKKLLAVPEGIKDLVERHAVRSSIKMERAALIQREALDALQSGNIPCALLKGMTVAQYYPNPELRLPGDIDILIGSKDMEKADKLLKQWGFLFDEKTDLHASYYNKGVLLEIHDRVSIFPDIPGGRYAEEYLMNAECQTHIQHIREHTFPALTQTYQMLSLLIHIERHMGASGIGLRQLCDWAIAVHHMATDEERHVLSVLEACGLLKFAKVLTRTCEVYLHLPERMWTQGVHDSVVNATMEDILSVGNFVAQQKNRPFGSAVIDPYDLTGNGKRNLVTTYYRRVEQKMRADYSWASSKIYVPLFCMYYPIKWMVDVATGKRMSADLLNTLRTANKREKLLRRMGLYR